MERKISSRVTAKQKTAADVSPAAATPTTHEYTATSTASQSVINLSFAVDQSNKKNFLLIINGSVLTEGASNDYQFTSIQANNTSSQVTLNYAIAADLNIRALYLGMLYPAQAASSISNVQATANSALATSTKNLLINSAFDLWQRGTSVTVANGVSTYQADRWYAKNSLGANGVLTFSRVTGTQQGSKYGAQVVVSTGPFVAGTGGIELYQVLENLDSLQLYGQAASFGVYVKGVNNVNQIGLQFCYATSEIKPSTFIGSETLVSVSNSGFTLCQALNQSIGTLMTTAGVIGVRIRVTGVSSGNVTDFGNGFVVEQAMLNVGATLGSFARAGRNAQDELAMCQRYYVKSYAPDVAIGTVTDNGTYHFIPQRTDFAAPFGVQRQMRTNPSIGLYSDVTGAGPAIIRRQDGTPSDVAMSASATGANGHFYIAGTLVIGNHYSFHFTAEAEI